MHRKAKSLNSVKICHDKVRACEIPHVFANNGSFLVSVHRNRVGMANFLGFASFPRRARRLSKSHFQKSAGQRNAPFCDLLRSSKNGAKKDAKPKKVSKQRKFSCKKYPYLCFVIPKMPVFMRISKGLARKSSRFACTVVNKVSLVKLLKYGTFPFCLPIGKIKNLFFEKAHAFTKSMR